jgi:hypothetical protein
MEGWNGLYRRKAVQGSEVPKFQGFKALKKEQPEGVESSLVIAISGVCDSNRQSLIPGNNHCVAST